MPKNKVSDLITDQEMVFARLVLSGNMTDRDAAQAVGLSPDTGTAEEISHRHVGCRVHVVFPTAALCGILRGSAPPPSAHESGTGPRRSASRIANALKQPKTSEFYRILLRTGTNPVPKGRLKRYLTVT